MDINAYRILEGNFITLKAIHEDDAQDIYNWRTSASGIHLNQPRNYSPTSQLVWIKSRPDNELNFIIYKKGTTPEKVGMIGVVDIDEQNKKAEVGRLLLNEKFLDTSTPFGLEALKITYDLVLNKWNFNKIYGNILATNLKMIELQKFLGMQQEGVLKRHLFLKNDYTDLHLFAIFPDDLNKKFIPRINFLLKGFK